MSARLASLLTILPLRASAVTGPERAESSVRCRIVASLRWCLGVCCGLMSCGLICADDATADKEVFFREQVLPILEEHCFECHSHQSQTMEAGLALDYRSGWEQGGDSGPAIVPRNPEGSLLLKAVRREGDLEMPPDSPLAAEQVQVIEKWIREGAVDPRTTTPKPLDSDWWSLRELASPAIPSKGKPLDVQPEHASSLAHSLYPPSNPIDAFIEAELDQRGLQPSPLADRRTLMRRLYIDMLGVLPTYDQVAAFEADSSTDAYERLVDRVLASPAYGQRWTRHWMDTIHFAESHGFEHDVARPNAWPYHDYLIARFNSDVPWSRFIREQLAADHFFPGEPQWTPALGFLGAGTFDISSFMTAPKTFAYLDRDDMVTQTMSAIASTTVNCARCHTHKFDPVTQEDYFALQAVFAGLIKGDIAFDADPAVAAERQRLESLLQSVDQQSTDVLLSAEWTATIEKWEQNIQRDADRWKVCDLATFQAADGPRLEKQTDGSILAHAPFPERAQYVVTFQPPVKRLTAVRIEVMTDESLPQSGPGAAVNGNLHLTEVEMSLLAGSGGEKKALRLSKAMADFDQEGWIAAHAIDGKQETAWGIHPQESRSHVIVIELAEPLDLEDNTPIELRLHQAHGRQHIIGRFRIAATEEMHGRLVPLSDVLLAALHTASEARSMEQKLLIASAALRAHLNDELAKLPVPTRVYAAASKILDGNGISAQAIATPQAIHLLGRGDIEKPLRPVGPGSLSAIGALKGRFELDATAGESARRAALAEWLVDAKNPLTWRSIANRLWHYHFGRGLCDTPSDFGRMGGEASHPKLLDWLACELRDGGESLKRLHRLIVTSRTYCQASEGLPELHVASMTVDAENRWLWRQNRLRLDADCYRDAVLAASGRLDRAFGGPSVQQFSTSPGQQLTPVLDYSTFDWNSSQAGRRSIYRFVWRGIADPFMESLDFPDLGLLTPQRGNSSSALQALAMYNNDFVLFHADQLAEHIDRSINENGPDHVPGHNFDINNVTAGAIDPLTEKLCAVFRSTLQREPTETERTMFRPLAEKRGLAAVVRVIFNSNEFLFLD